MISVQNHRLLLSGSNMRFILFLFGILLMSSCGLFTHTTQTPPPKPPKENTTEVKEEKKEEVKITHTTVDTVKINPKLKRWDKKDSYEIALLLPFSIDNAELDKLISEDNITGYQPLASLEFYEGALMAIDTLKKLGVNLNIVVYDTKKDSLSTAILMQHDEFAKMDLIIGPVFNDGLRAAAKIAKEKEVYTVSPLSPQGNITEENKFFLMANAPIATQLQKTIDYITTEHKNANIILVFRESVPYEQKIAEEFRTEFITANKNKFSSLKEASSISGVQENLSDAENFIFLASNDEYFANGFIRDLSKMSRNNDITLLGLQSLLSLESISLDYFETLHFQYPTCYWVDQNAPRVKEFNTTFTYKYGIRPSEFAYRGYDLLMYFGTLMSNYGPAIDQEIGKPNMAARYMLYPLKFTPSYIGLNKQIQYLENSNITILKYENYRFEKVN